MARKNAKAAAASEIQTVLVETPVVETLTEETVAEPMVAVAEETPVVEEINLENIMEETMTVEETPDVVAEETIVDPMAEIERLRNLVVNLGYNPATGDKVDRRMGKQHTFGKNFEKTDKIIEVLSKFETEKPSRFLTQQLIDAGLVTFDKVEKEGRGRRAYIYRLTEAARKLVEKPVDTAAVA